jgi:hypothetical protein
MLAYTDGFEPKWKPKVFAEFHDVKLYKLHGSVVWYIDENNDCSRFDVIGYSRDEKLKLRSKTGLALKPLTVFPGQKSEYLEPLIELQLMFRARLRNPVTRILIIVGYSFRDDYIRKIIWDAMKVNPELHIFLVDPNSHWIYENKLRFLDNEKTISSPIDGKVICLPYEFANITAILKDRYVNELENGLELERNPKEVEYEINPRGFDKVNHFVQCEFFSKVKSILTEEVDIDSLVGGYKWTSFHNAEICFKGLLYSILSGDELQDYWLTMLNKSLSFINTKLLDFDISNEGYRARFSNHPCGFVLALLNNLISFFEEKERLAGKNSTKLDRIRESYELLKSVQNYLAKISHIPTDEGDFSNNWSHYFDYREGSSSIIQAELNKDKSLSNDSRDLIREYLLSNEQTELKRTLNGDSLRMSLSA